MTVLDASLLPAAGLDCDVPLEAFGIFPPRTESKVRFVARTAYGWGPGLQYIHFEYDSNFTETSGWRIYFYNIVVNFSFILCSIACALK